MATKICSGLKLLTPGNPKTVKGEKKRLRDFHPASCAREIERLRSMPNAHNRVLHGLP